MIAIVLTIVAAVFLPLVYFLMLKPILGWISDLRRGPSSPVRAPLPDHKDDVVPQARFQLESLREHDPNFSLVLFEDFLCALYVQAYTLRGGGALQRLSAYLKPDAQDELVDMGQVAAVKEIIVGAMRLVSATSFGDASDKIRVEVEFESNYTEVGPEKAAQGYYSRETWRLTRAKNVLSRTPDRIQTFACPSCKAPLDTMEGGTCKYCGSAVNTGAFDWVVESIADIERETRPPVLTSNTEEEGTNLPTVIAPDLQARRAALTERDPQFSWPSLQTRVAAIFTQMQVAWANRDLRPVRPFISDNLFHNLSYWTEAYKKAGLRNVTEGAQIDRIELARITSDRFFDAVTARVHAHSTDFTVADGTDQIVSGNRTSIRSYTEYWTLIRGAQRKGGIRPVDKCPACGAPLKIEMAGTCAYCTAKITSGEFDWVLSRIEQDETYRG